VDETKIRQLLKESYDLHYHIGPDILPRKYNVSRLVAGEAGKIGGVVLKSHSFPTIALINAFEGKTDMTLIGSVTLNYFMGGFNDSAIYASSVMSKKHPIFVWFPTVHAENHLIHNKSEYEIPPEWVKDPSFKPRDKHALKAIRVTDWAGKLIRKAATSLDTMAENNCILATGHISWQESEVLAREALDRGIKTIITHPMQKDINMPLDVQKKLADMGAYIEYCYIMYLDRDYPQDYPPQDQANAINEIGQDRVILTSDGGQTKNPSPSDCMMDYIKLLTENGVDSNQIPGMIKDNPRKILEK
jgi:hypothetical protein